MKYNPIALEKFLKDYHTSSPTQGDLESFKAQISKLHKVNEQESEEHQKNAFISLVLRDTFHYECNTKEKIDLAIYEEGQVRVIFECKSVSNRSEFVKDKDNLDSKALSESILYYLREFLTHKNNNLTFIVLTNMRDFYLIDAKEYLVFAKNKDIKKAFDNCEKKQGNDSSTKRFYDEMEKILPKLDHTFTYTHFTLSLKSDLAHIYKILSPKVLLKTISYIDANTLNQRFYDELLYILGLQEVTQNSKVFIEASQTPNTLLDALCQAYGFDSKKDFEIIFSFLTTWNNRILFLRLLESMLLSFKHIDSSFLHIQTIKDFSTLQTLFFEVLAKKEEKRSDIPPFLSSIPYLNSSLFDKSTFELEGKEIKLLDSKPLELYPHSILHKDEAFKRDYKDANSLPLLEYLFAFLHAYDFTTIPSDIQDDIKINQNKLINSAVLGLVFEKLNGYKEGSFYTPSFITNYMCKESLQKVVINKFNQAKGWDCQDLESLKSKIDQFIDSKDDYREANAIFDSMKICDPSVGSGHFLVSALNWLIYLKFELKILCDENNHRLKDIVLTLQNDEILMRDSQNKIFNYSLPKHENIESHKLQKALFEAKRKLIESCLFGVDINPNSCEITKLRLWIELLKYSYYKDIENKRLETLPNIDINIKCGNSLVSRFDIKDSLKHIPNIAYQIDEYKKLVLNYKQLDRADAFEKELLMNSKREIEHKIQNIKQSFTLTLRDSKTKEQLQKAINDHIALYGSYLLDDESLLDGLDKPQHNLFGTPSLNEEEEESALDSYSHIQKLRKKLDLTLKGEGYKDAFEWRFEFPEILSEDGDFLGFDLIIGNPPYIDYRRIDTKIKNHLMKQSQVYRINKEGSIYVYFIEKARGIMSLDGNCIFINPIAYICTESGKGIRNFIDKNFDLLQIVDVSDFKVFASASTYTCINYFQHKADDMVNIKFARVANENELDSVRLREIPNVKIENLSVQLDFIATKIDNIRAIKLSDYCDIFCGLSIAGFRADVVNNAENTNVPFLESSDILRYDFKIGKYLKRIKSYYSQEKINIFQDSEIVFMARMTNFIRCCVAPKGYYGGKVNILHNFKIDKNFVVGILNSKLLSYFYTKKYFASHMQGGAFGFDTISVGNLPIPKIDSKNKTLTNKVISLVDKILESKAKDPQSDTSSLESKIDSLVYELYDLSEEEIRIVEGR